MPQDDTRTPEELMRQWEKLNQIRRQLVTQGVISTNASVNDVIPALRKTIPQDLFNQMPAVKQ